MAKHKTQFVCQECGWAHPKWVGQCQSCGEWNSLVEEEQSTSATPEVSETQTTKVIHSLPEAQAMKGSFQRVSTTIGELDRVLGADSSGSGMVKGGVILIGGEPGIGKSTLLTQMAVALVEANFEAKKKMTIAYVAGEENPNQIALRIQRVANQQKKSQTAATAKKRSEYLGKSLSFVTSTQLEVVLAALDKLKPNIVIVDSIQTITSERLSGAAGSVGQVKIASEELTRFAKNTECPVFLVGHVTKEGQFAGPKVLEHIVDTVLEFSGERTGDLRLLRAIKNRFGTTDEVGVFRMREDGFESVSNPSELFLEEREQPVPGSVPVCLLEGNRPLVVEIQSLVVSSQLAMPRRVGRGVELSRIQVLSAVAQKHCNLPLGTTDIFVSIAGGFASKEPAVDLGLVVAMASSMNNKALPAGTICIGEVGLLGEIRKVNFLERRIKEAKRLGFAQVISRNSHHNLKDVLKDLKLTKKLV